MAFEDR